MKIPSTVQRRLARVALVSVIMGLGSCKADREPWSLEQARIVFTSREDRTPRLRVLDWSTGVVSALSADSAGAWSPGISGDGLWLAYVSKRTGNYEIYLRMLDAPEPGTNLTNHPDYDVLPAWSPDGRWLAFMSTRGYTLGGIGPFPGHLYLVGADGTGLERLTTEPLTSSLGPGGWSRDGRFLALSRSIDGQLELFLLEVSTGEERRITTTAVSEYSADFAHDGRRLAFHAEDSTGSRIVVSDLDGSKRRVVTPGPGRRYSPRWSPDDAWLLFTAEERETGRYQLWVVRVADGREQLVPGVQGDAREGIWLPGSVQ